MTTLNDRPNTAVLVIDVQTGVLDGAHERGAIVANIVGLVDKARAADVPVIWVQHTSENLPTGSDAWRIAGEFTQAESEPVVHKRYGDSFEETELETVLARGRVGHVIIAGAQTDECVRSTLHGAIVRGYDTTLVSDAHTTEDLTEWGAPTPDKVIAHTNLYWGNHTAPGRRARAVSTAELTFD